MNFARSHPLFSCLVIVCAVFVGCGVFGLPTPTTFNERLAAGYSTVTAIRAEGLSLLNAKLISPEDSQNVQTQADNARAALDLAGITFARDPVAANTKLTATITILTALQTYLASRRPAT